MSGVSTELTGVLEFLRAAERLKNVHRSAWTSAGARESVAEHTWRLCLMAVVLSDEFESIDVGRLLKMCIVHDLGEAIGGDIPAIHQDPAAPKSAEERRDLITLLEPLPEKTKQAILALWDEYEAATSPEAKVAKALDKLETIMQHNQGLNPDDFDFRFNLTYGTRYTGDHPLIARIRAVLDEETEQRAQNAQARDHNIATVPIADSPAKPRYKGAVREALSIRVATLKDLPSIVHMLADDILGQQREDPQHPLSASYVAAFNAIDADPNNEIIVACNAEGVVAALQITYTPSVSYQGSWRATLESVRTAADLRGQGIGTILVEHAIARASERGCRSVQLTTHKQRVAARRFYERLGFTASHEGMKLSLSPS